MSTDDPFAADAPPAAAPVPDKGYVEFEVDGVPYRTYLFAPTEGGLEIMWLLSAIGVEPLGRLAEGFAATGALADLLKSAIASIAGGAGGSAVVNSVEDAMGDMEISLDFSLLAADVKKAILSVDAAALHRRILSRTLRQNKRLSDDTVFNSAYQTNYFESQKAAWKVIEANGWLPF